MNILSTEEMLSFVEYANINLTKRIYKTYHIGKQLKVNKLSDNALLCAPRLVERMDRYMLRVD